MLHFMKNACGIEMIKFYSVSSTTLEIRQN